MSCPTGGAETIQGFTGPDTQEVAAGFFGLGLGPLDPARFVANAAGAAVGAGAGAKIVHDTDEGVLGYDPDGAGGAA